jgi:rhodanese-related sulfurtransferase
MAACLVLLLGPSLLAGCFGGEAPDANRTPSSEEAPVQGSTNSPEAQYRRITAAQARDMMDSGDPYILLDVRSVEEYHEGYIANAILIPHAEIKGRAAGELADLDATILVYCRSGVRSSAAAHDLVALGYTGVYDMGGIMDWPYGTVQD